MSEGPLAACLARWVAELGADSMSCPTRLHSMMVSQRCPCCDCQVSSCYKMCFREAQSEARLLLPINVSIFSGRTRCHQSLSHVAMPCKFTLATCAQLKRCPLAGMLPLFADLVGDGKSLHGTGKEESWHVLPLSCATMRLFNYDFFRRIVTRHDVGLGESYMHGDFEVRPPRELSSKDRLMTCAWCSMLA